VKFKRDFDLANGSRAVVRGGSENERGLLIEKIRGATTFIS
jgi:hypothetical protein